MSRIDAQSKTGDSQPVTTVAMALPADPSRADPKVRIHHHGNEASTVIIAAPTLRASFFIVLLIVRRGGEHAFAKPQAATEIRRPAASPSPCCSAAGPTAPRSAPLSRTTVRSSAAPVRGLAA